jgi:BirA family biotin operon repressor/biotin-[acetyl-CoA-carboxylase] ligase
MPKNRLTSVARKLRRDQTDAEKLLWSHLRNRQLEDAKFVRQFPIGPFVADFACRSLKLIVELDGGQHGDNPSDLQRTLWIEGQGYRVLRFWNKDVMENIEGVLKEISAEIELARSSAHLFG